MEWGAGATPLSAEFWFLNFQQKTYAVTPHLNGLGETVLLRGHNLCFDGQIR